MEPEYLEVQIASLCASQLSRAQVATIQALVLSRFDADASPTGTELPHRDLALVIGVDPAWARKTLRQLVDLQVLEVAMASAGRRANVYRFRPIPQWLTFDRTTLKAVQLRVELARVPHETPPEPEFAPRPSAALGTFAPRHRTSRNARSAAPQRGANSRTERVREVPQRGANVDTPRDPIPLSLSRENSPSLQSERESAIDQQKAVPVLAAIAKKTPITGDRRWRVILAVQPLDAFQLDQLADAIHASGLRTATKLAEWIEDYCAGRSATTPPKATRRPCRPCDGLGMVWTDTSDEMSKCRACGGSGCENDTTTMEVPA